MRKQFLLITLPCIFICLSVTAQFTEQTVNPAPLVNVSHSAVAWGDYNNDNRLDILLTGSGSTVIYTNYQVWPIRSFVRLSTVNELPGVSYGAVKWGDYDNDGDLDFVLAGTVVPGANANGAPSIKQITKIYRNDGGNPCRFTDIEAVLTGICRGAVAWGDYDNDRDLDLIIAGDITGTGASGVSKIYANEGGDNFIEQTSIVLPGVAAGASVAWADYDKDGDLDFVLTGSTEWPEQRITKIYRNNYPLRTFTVQPFSLLGSQAGSSAWGDYDKDGDEDLIVAGLGTVKLYRNNFPSNTFTDIVVSPVPLIQVSVASVAWGDYDNDGDLDILLAGSKQNTKYTKIYKNDGGNVFTELSVAPVPLAGVGVGSVTWADYDNDKDLDILVTGLSNENRGVTKLYRNMGIVANTVPAKPTNLTATPNGEYITFNWSRSTDNETPQAGLTYNIVISNEYKGFDILSPMSNMETGFRRIVSSGNTRHNTTWAVKGLSGGIMGRVYYCGVQAIDNTFAGSPFEIQKFRIPGFFEGVAGLLIIAAVIIAIAFLIIRKKYFKKNM